METESNININMRTQERTEVMVKTLRDYVNSTSSDHAAFNELMSRQHRTLQQSFTRLALHWIDHIAKDEYATDMRNQYSKEVAQKIVRLMEKEEGFEFKYSAACPHI